MLAHQLPNDIYIRQLRLRPLTTVRALDALLQGRLVAVRIDPEDRHVSAAHYSKVLLEDGGVRVVILGQARRHEDDITLLREFSHHLKDGRPEFAPQLVVCFASVGDHCGNGIDEQVVVQ